MSPTTVEVDGVALVVTVDSQDVRTRVVSEGALFEPRRDVQPAGPQDAVRHRHGPVVFLRTPGCDIGDVVSVVGLDQHEHAAVGELGGGDACHAVVIRRLDLREHQTVEPEELDADPSHLLLGVRVFARHDGGLGCGGQGQPPVALPVAVAVPRAHKPRLAARVARRIDQAWLGAQAHVDLHTCKSEHYFSSEDGGIPSLCRKVDE